MIETIEKKLFIKNLPGIQIWEDEQQFISDLIEDEYLTKSQQYILRNYFNTLIYQQRRDRGNYTFRVLFLFTNPESCLIFDKKRLEQARIDIIPNLSKWSIGDMKKNVEEYAKNNPIFNKLYTERKEQEKEKRKKKSMKIREISGYKITMLQKLQQIIIDVAIPGLVIEFSEKEYKILMQGYYSKTMEEKWNIIPEGNVLHFCHSWTGDEIYRAEILHEKCEHGEYKIRTFFVDKNRVDEYFLEYVDFSIHSLILLLFWGILKKDIRHLIIEKYGQGEKGALRLWSEFGNMLFTESDYVSDVYERARE